MVVNTPATYVRAALFKIFFVPSSSSVSTNFSSSKSFEARSDASNSTGKVISWKSKLAVVNITETNTKSEY